MVLACAKSAIPSDRAIEPLGDADDIDEGSAEILPDRRKGLPDCRWRCRPSEPLDYPLAFQLAKTIREHLR